MTVKLINGDCIEKMRKLIDEGVKVDLILTDPLMERLREWILMVGKIKQ